MISDNAFMIVKTILDYINVFFVIYLIGYSSFLFLAVVVGSSELYKKRHQEKLVSFWLVHALRDWRLYDILNKIHTRTESWIQKIELQN